MLISLIETAMKNVGGFEFDSILKYQTYTIPLSLVVLFWAMKTGKKKQNPLLEALNLDLSEKRPVKVKRHKKFLEFSNIKPEALKTSFWRERFEILENIYQCKLIDVRIQKGFFPKVQLFYDNLPKKVPFDTCPELKPMEIWAGKDQFGKDVILNLQDTPALYLDGKPGSGKTVALTAIMKSFQKGIGERVKFIVTTTKPADYFKLEKSEEFDLEIINPFDNDIAEGVRKSLIALEPIKELEQLFKDTVSKFPEIDQDDLKMERLRRKGICASNERYFYIFDEAKDYLSKEKADSKEVSQAKLELSNAVHTHIRRTARFLSVPILVASQTQTETDLDIPLKTFHLRFASSTNQAMSRLICGDKRLTNLSFKQGKFFINTDKQEYIVRTPWVS